MPYLSVSSSKESPTDRLREVLNEALTKTEAEYKRIETVAVNNYPPIQPVEQCNGFGRRQISISDYESYYYGGSDYERRYGSKRTADQVEAYCKKLAEEMKAKAEEIHAKNVPAIESNQRLIAALTALMGSIKMPSKWTKRDYGATGRARTQRSYSVNAGWIDDIQREIRTDDGYASVESDYKRFLADIQTYVTCKRAEEAEAKRKADEEAAKTEKVRLLGVYQGRYGLPVTATPHDVLDHVLSLNRHLRLAHYLYLNRCSWADGPSLAEAGLNGFSVETDVDRSIVAAIEPSITDWDGDGRVFRDGEWSYDAIFALVPPEIKKQYDEVLGWVGTDSLV